MQRASASTRISIKIRKIRRRLQISTPLVLVLQLGRLTLQVRGGRAGQGPQELGAVGACIK